MNNSTKADVRKDAPAATGGGSTRRKEKEARPYVPPTIQTFSGEQILQEIDPAQDIGTGIPGVNETL